MIPDLSQRHEQIAAVQREVPQPGRPFKARGPQSPGRSHVRGQVAMILLHGICDGHDRGSATWALMTRHSKSESIDILAARLRDDLAVRPILLLGAGASRSSGVPMAYELARRIATWHYARLERHGTVNPGDVAWPDVQAWLKTQDWYDAKTGLAEAFPTLVGRLMTPVVERARKLAEFTKAKQLGPGYRRLTELAEKNLFKTVLTTNFDECLPAMYGGKDPLQRAAQVNRWPRDFAEFEIDKRQIVWLHGRIEQYSDCNKGSEVKQLKPALIELLRPALRAAPLIVVGYRGAEPSIMESLLRSSTRKPKFFKNGVYWCSLEHEALHPAVLKLKEAIGDDDFFDLAIEGFDELMESLMWALVDHDVLHPDRRRSRGPALDLLSEHDALSVLCYDAYVGVWKNRPIDCMLSATGTKPGRRFTNKIPGYVHNHAKIVYRGILRSDFEAKIDISGDVLDIQLQMADGSDRNIYVTPRSFPDIDVRKTNSFIIRRDGRSIHFGIVVNGKIRTLDFSVYQPPEQTLGLETMLTCACFLSIAVAMGDTVEITRFAVRS